MNHFAVTLTSIRRSPILALVAIFTLTITFFVGYVFSFLVVGGEMLLRHLEKQPQVTVYFVPDTSSASIASAAGVLKEKPYVQDIKQVSQEEALALYRQQHADDQILLELVTASMLPPSLEVAGTSLSDLQQIREDVKTFDNVDEIVFQQDVVDRIQTFTSTLRKFGLTVLVVLILHSLFVTMVMISIKAATRKKSIQILRLLGATRWYVKLPFIYEGMLYGIASAVLAWLGVVVMSWYLTPWLKWLQSFFGTIQLAPIPWQVYGAQLGIGVLVGIILGFLASVFAVQRLLKKY
jgi:cell division transport system permease protein